MIASMRTAATRSRSRCDQQIGTPKDGAIPKDGNRRPSSAIATRLRSGRRPRWLPSGSRPRPRLRRRPGRRRRRSGRSTTLTNVCATTSPTSSRALGPQAIAWNQPRSCSAVLAAGVVGRLVGPRRRRASSARRPEALHAADEDEADVCHGGQPTCHERTNESSKALDRRCCAVRRDELTGRPCEGRQKRLQSWPDECGRQSDDAREDEHRDGFACEGRCARTSQCARPDKHHREQEAFARETVTQRSGKWCYERRGQQTRDPRSRPADARRSNARRRARRSAPTLRRPRRPMRAPHA